MPDHGRSNQLMKYKKTAIFILAFIIFIVILVLIAPSVYKSYVNKNFASLMNSNFGSDGWVTLYTGADLQWNDEQINLYRTLYVRYIFPNYQKYTPWKNLTFTHGCSCPKRPWHYHVTIITKDNEITYYWSIRGNKWEKIWSNKIRNIYDYDPEKVKIYDQMLACKEKRNGLNYSKEPLLERLR